MPRLAEFPQKSKRETDTSTIERFSQGFGRDQVKTVRQKMPRAIGFFFFCTMRSGQLPISSDARPDEALASRNERKAQGAGAGCRLRVPAQGAAVMGVVDQFAAFFCFFFRAQCRRSR